MGHSRQLILSLCLFNIVDKKRMFNKQVSWWLDSNHGPLVLENERSTNWATTTEIPLIHNFGIRSVGVTLAFA